MGPKEADQISIALVDVSPALVDQELCDRMSKRVLLGQHQMAMGSNNVLESSTIALDDDGESTSDEESSASSGTEDENVFKQMCGLHLTGKIDLDDIMISAAEAGNQRGIDFRHPSKIWFIKPDDAKRTLEITTQNSTREQDPILARNCGTNDCML